MIKAPLFHRLLSVALLCFGLGQIAQLAHAEDVDPKLKNKIEKRLQQARPEFSISDVSATPIDGLYQAQIVNGPMVYVTADGEYLIAGDLFQVSAKGLVNVSEQGRNEERAAALAKVDINDMIVFSPKGKAKAHVTVFTDIDCGYCRKLHQEVPELNKMGIEVRYLAYPRAGLNSESHQKLATAWCSENPQDTLTRFKSGESVPLKVCEDNPVAMEYTLGRQIGVTATPALVLESGELQLGYMKAPQLAARLGVTP
jgi:thiol:disulfide interchange protein DsbC